jgi:hypothetical protein
MVKSLCLLAGGDVAASRNGFASYSAQRAWSGYVE